MVNASPWAGLSQEALDEAKAKQLEKNRVHALEVASTLSMLKLVVQLLKKNPPPASNMHPVFEVEGFHVYLEKKAYVVRDFFTQNNLDMRYCPTAESLQEAAKKSFETIRAPDPETGALKESYLIPSISALMTAAMMFGSISDIVKKG